MIHFNIISQSFGPWYNLEYYLYKDQAKDLFMDIYEAYCHKIANIEDFVNLFFKADSCCRLLFLDTHPELNYKDYIEYCNPYYFCDEEDLDSIDYNEEDVDFIHQLTFVVVLLLLKCKKNHNTMLDLFIKNSNAYIEDKFNEDVLQTLNNEKYDMFSGTYMLDFGVSSFHDPLFFPIKEESFHGFDDTYRFWTKEDCMRFVRMGPTEYDQASLYELIKKTAIEKYNKAVVEDDKELIKAFENASYIRIYKKEADVETANVYIEEFELTDFNLFQSYITLGALDSVDETKQRTSSSDNLFPELEDVLMNNTIEDLPKTITESTETVENSDDSNTQDHLENDCNRVRLAFFYRMLKKAYPCVDLSVYGGKTALNHILSFVTGIPLKACEKYTKDFKVNVSFHKETIDEQKKYLKKIGITDFEVALQESDMTTLQCED